MAPRMTRQRWLVIAAVTAIVVTVLPNLLSPATEGIVTRAPIRAGGGGSVTAGRPTAAAAGLVITPSPPQPTAAVAFATLPPSTPEPTPTPAPTEAPPKSVHAMFTAWSGGKPLTAANVPLPDTGRIPDRLVTTWKTKTLGTNARRFWDNFRAHEPQLEPVILDDAECGELATLYPNLKKRYDALPLNVMRADICRVLAVYFFGGYYKDLDVDWRKPLKDWIEPTDGIVYGWEDDEHLCQWFFAAKPGDPCLRNILQQITNLIANTSNIDFNKNVEAVIDITGPGVWTDALQGCPLKPKYTVQQMKFDYVYHDYASQRWGSAEYKSWIEDRKEKAGWSEVWPAFRLAPFYTTSSDDHLLPIREDLPAIDVSVRVGSVANGMPQLYGPANAFDGSLDTAVETTAVSEHAWLEIVFPVPMTIGTTDAAPGPNHLTGIRIFNRHRELGGAHFNQPVHVQLFDATGKLFFSQSKEGRTTTQYLFSFGGMPSLVSKVRFYKKITGGALTFSEIQLYSDHLHREARAVTVVAATSATETPTLPKILALATTRTEGACKSPRALSPTIGFQYTHCGPLPAGDACRAYSISSQGPDGSTRLDADFVALMHLGGCPLVTVGPSLPVLTTEKDDARIRRHHNVNWCAETPAGKDCDTFAEFEKTVLKRAVATGAVEHATVVYADVAPEEWLEPRMPPALSVLTKLKPATLFLPVRITPTVAASETALRHMESLMELYEVVSVHVGIRPAIAPEVSIGSLEVPGELQVTLVPRRPRRRATRRAKQATAAAIVATTAAADTGDDGHDAPAATAKSLFAAAAAAVPAASSSSSSAKTKKLDDSAAAVPVALIESMHLAEKQDARPANLLVQPTTKKVASPPTAAGAVADEDHHDHHDAVGAESHA